MNIEQDKLSIQIDPNPVTSQSVIRFYNHKASIITIEIFDVLGNSVELLVNRHYAIGEHRLTFRQINNQHISKGIYFLRIKNDDGHSKITKFLF